MDDSMLQKADELLEDKQINTNVGVRLLIEMMAEEFRALNAVVENQNAQNEVIRAQNKKIEELEKKSIVLFVQKNPKVSIAIVAISAALFRGYDIWTWLMSLFNMSPIK